METDDKAFWLALLSADGVDRALAKRVLYRWAIGEHNALGACAGLSAAGLRALLAQSKEVKASVGAGELDDQEAGRWLSALATVDVARATLASLRTQGIDMLTRADAYYPENLAERLPERWLPYLLFYRGNLTLLSLPLLYVAGAETPSPEATAWAEGLVRRLTPHPLALLGGYAQGVDRQALGAAASAGGASVIMLPVGMGQAGPILRAGQAAVTAGRRLELSPYTPDTAYTPALGKARTMLTTGLADAMVMVEPDQGPDDWPGLAEHTGHGGAVFVWSRDRSSRAAGWVTAGATVVQNSAEADAAIRQHLGLGVEAEEPPAAEMPAGESPPVRFHDADSAIDLLNRSGHVPDSLARRLRDAEREGRLREDE